MKITVRPVDVNYIAQTWHLVESYIADAHKHGGGDYTLDQIRMYLATGTWLLLVATDEENKIHGAMTVSFLNYPNDRVAFVTTTGGKTICSEDTLLQLKELLKGMGATKIQAAGRPSMVRLLGRLGFNERYMVVETRI
jgi:hypothetical protein